MQEKFPVFILIASELLDLSGASRNEHRVRGAPGLSFPGEAQLRAESSSVPSEVFSVTEGDLDEVTFYFQTPAVDPTNEMTADFIPVHTETAAGVTATLPEELVGNVEGSDQLHAAAAALNLQRGHEFPNSLLSSKSLPISTQESQATTPPEQSGRSLPEKPETVTEAVIRPTSSSAGLPQPIPSAGMLQDSPEFTAVFSIPLIKQMEAPSPKVSLLASRVNFHPPRKETAASPFPTEVKMALESARVGWLPTLAPPTSKRPEDTNPQVQPDSRAAVTPAYLKKTRSVDAKITTSAFLQKPASGDLGAAYSRMTQTTAVQFSPVLSLKQGTAGSEGRNSTAVRNGSRHTAQLPALQQLLQGNVQSSSLLMHLEALGHDDLLHSPFQGPINAADRPQPLFLSRTVSCTKHHASQETNRSSQESAVLVSQRGTDHQMMTSRPEKSRFPESPQASSNSSSLSQPQISVLNLSQTTRVLKGATSALFPGTSTFENAALQPVSTSDAVQAALQPLGTSVPSYVGSQLMGIPTSAEKGLHIPTSSATPSSGSQLQGVSAHPAPREAFAMMLQMSTVEDSRGKKRLPHQVDKAGSPSLTPQASMVSSSSGLHDENQKASLHSFAPSSPHIQQPGSLEAFAPKLHPPLAQESQSSTPTARPEPAVPFVSGEVPAHLAQVLVQQFGMSRDAATKNLGAFRTDQLKMLPSPPYLSFLLRNTDGMICLLPMQDSPLPTRFPVTSAGTLVSVQQILAASNSSLLDLSDLQNVSPSSLILVKPVFILFPTDRADLQMVPSLEGEDDLKGVSSFTNKQGLNVVTPGCSHDVPVKTSSSYPINKRPETPLSTASNQRTEKTKVMSQPVLTNSSHTAVAGSSRAVSWLRISTPVQAAHLHRLPEAAPPSQEAKGADAPLLHGVAAEPLASPLPPFAVSAQRSPRTAPGVSFTAEKPPSSVTPLLPAVGLADFHMPAQPLFAITEVVDQVQHSKELRLQTTAHGQGSAAPPSSAHAECTERLSLHSARTVKYPLKMSTSVVPLHSTSQSVLSTELLRRLPPPVGFVPSTVSAFSAFPAGNDSKGSAAGSAACSGVSLHAKAAPTPPTSINPGLAKHSQLTPIVPKPFVRTETPALVPAHTPFSAKVHLKTATSGKYLATITHPRMHAKPPASLPALVSMHIPLPSAVKRDQSSGVPTELFSQANVGENAKPTEISTSARKIGAGGFLGTSMSLSAVFNAKAEQRPAAVLGSKAVLAPVQPSVSAESVIALEREPKLTQTTSQPPLEVTSLTAAKNDYITTSLTKKNVFFLPTSTLQSDPNAVFPTTAGMNGSAKVSTSAGKSEAVLAKEGEAAAASPLSVQAAVSSSHQASASRHSEKISLGDSIEHDTGRSSRDAAMQATGPSTTRSSSVPADRPANKVTNQSAVSNKAEMLLTRDLSPFPPAPESPSRPAQTLAARAPASDSPLGVTDAGLAGRLLLSTAAEEVVGPREVTEEAAEGSETALTLPGSEPRALLSASRQRRVLQLDGAALNGLAVVSDEVCGSGNYTVQMSLRPVAEVSPELQSSAPPRDTFLAFLAVQSSSSQPVLQVRSCCVTPSSSPGGPGAACCLFPRLPFECRHIRLLQSSNPRAASFTIQLFQMLNHSVAYLHCELNVCLRGTTGCEQDCFESMELPPQPGDRNSYGNLRNLISFGPVLRTKDRFLYKPVEGSDSAMLVPILLGSLTGFAVLGSAFTSLWLHHRRKIKNLGYPQFGEIRGL